MHFDEFHRVIRNHMPGLDALRGIAILWVILHNAALDRIGLPQSIAMKIINLIGNAGWVGVQLFFVLSGFLITGILLDGLGSNRQLRNFYARRTLRISPLYYGFLLLAFIILPWLDIVSWPAKNGMEKLLYWTYLSNWGLLLGIDETFPHLWSLAIEEQYYLIWPLLVISLRKSNLAYICLALIISAFLFRAFVVINFDSSFSSRAMYTFTVARWDSLAFGSLLAFLVRSDKALSYLQRYVHRSFIVLSILIAIQVTIFRNFSSTNVLGIFNQTSIALWFSMLIFLSIVPWRNKPDIPQMVLSARLLRWFGKYSYAIYIFHFPVKMIWFSYFYLPENPHSPWYQLGVVVYNFLGITTLAILAAIISWYVLEEPFLKLKRYF